MMTSKRNKPTSITTGNVIASCVRKSPLTCWASLIQLQFPSEMWPYEPCWTINGVQGEETLLLHLFEIRALPIHSMHHKFTSMFLFIATSTQSYPALPPGWYLLSMVTLFLTQWNSSATGAFSSFLILSYRLWKIYVYEVCSVLLSCDIVLTAQMKFQVRHYQTEYALEKLFFWVFYFTLSHLKNAEQATRNEKEIKALIRHRTSAYAYVEASMQSEYAHG